MTTHTLHQGRSRAIRIYRVEPGERNQRDDDQGVQCLVECARGEIGDYHQGGEYVAQCQFAVSEHCGIYSRGGLYSFKISRVDDIEDDSQLRRGQPGVLVRCVL